MPGRFSSLEFTDEQHEDLQGLLQQTETVRDEHYYLAQAKEAYQWGEWERALRMYTRALEDNRAVIPAWVGQVQMLVQLGELKEARLWSDKALELFRSQPELLAAKAQACLRLEDQDAAYACSDASLQSPGSSPWRWQVRGEVLLASGKKRFDECFRKALTEPLADWFDRVLIARIYQHYERHANALEYLKELVEAGSHHGIVWYELGRCQHELGLIPAAAVSYRHCLELRGNYQPAQEALTALSVSSPLAWLDRLFRRRRRRTKR